MAGEACGLTSLPGFERTFDHMTDPKSAPSYSPLWKPLYSSIKKFIQTRPWDLFENEDVFMVQTPVDGQMYLCGVMGNGGEEFGLNAYRGAQGMRSVRCDHIPALSGLVKAMDSAMEDGSFSDVFKKE